MQSIVVHLPVVVLAALCTCFLVGAVVLLGYGYVRQRHALQRYHAKEQQTLKEMGEARRISEHTANFLATMSHEIRTPLNGMIGTTEMLLEAATDTHQRWQLSTVMHSAEALLRIINDILDYSKIESGKLLLEEVPFDPADILEALVHESTPKLNQDKPRDRLELILSFDEALPAQYLGDPLRLRQIMANLLSNAVKFTPHGHVVLRAEPMRNKVGLVHGIRLSVADTGIGISQERQHAVFDKFVQEKDATTSRLFGGSGLGLAICRELVQLMQGRIMLHSREGFGTTFTVELPLVPVPKAALAPAQVPVAFTGRRALIIEHSMASATVLRGYLGELGIRCFICEDITAAADTLRYVREGGMSVDYLFVSDALMDGSPEQAMQQMRALSPGITMQSIMLSMHDRHQAAQAFAQAGGQGCLRKPVLRRHLLRLLKQLDAPPCRFVDTLYFNESRPRPSSTAHACYPDRRVLLVEDNRVNREMALEMLRRFGMQVDQAEQGAAAVEMMLTRPYDLVLMDCQMPVMDGFEASSILRKHMQSGHIRSTPIIALTANAMRGDRERCLAAGMDDYLGKPLRLQDIEATLARWLGEAAPKGQVA